MNRVNPNRRMLRWLTTLLCSTLLVSAVVGCASSRNSSLAQNETKITEAKTEGDLEAALKEADIHWEKRVERAELQKAIDGYRKAVGMKSPELSEEEREDKIARAYERLSRAYYFMADGHVRTGELGDKDREAKMTGLYEKGITAAEKAIVLRDPNLAKAISGGTKLRKIVANADASAVPALYWYATNLGKWGLLEGIATILKYKDDIKATMDFICDTDPKYYYGGCYRYFGAYWTKIPFGKDPAKSKTNFDKSIEMAPNYLATKVLKANYYAELTQDPELYEKLLKEVVEADLDKDASIRPENVYERKKAEKLLKQTQEKFY